MIPCVVFQAVGTCVTVPSDDSSNCYCFPVTQSFVVTFEKRFTILSSFSLKLKLNHKYYYYHEYLYLGLYLRMKILMKICDFYNRQ